VEVVAQSVVGPYQAVTLRSSQGDALDRWLDANGFETPDSVVPVISAYAREGFDFIALKLRPGVNVRSMRPVRIVTPGASPVLPLRMVTAGIGAKVGLALWVISEGRWETQSFPNAIVDSTRIAWNNAERRSNYRELAAEALRGENGRVWLTEYSARNYDGGFAKELYRGACASLPMVKVSCEGSSTDLPWDGGAPDAQAPSTDAGIDADTDAGPDAGSDDAAAPDAAAPCTVLKKACDLFDDFDTALEGLHASDVWITKLRAELTPKDCASGDLSLAAARSQESVSSAYATQKFTDPTFDPCAGVRSPNGSSPASSTPSSAYDDRSGCACKLSAIGEALPPEPIALGAVGVLAALRLARRRKR
jgi:hypothetical protein